MAWQTCCCLQPVACHIKRVTAYHTKWGETAFTGDDRRRWLVLTQTVNVTGAPGGGVLINTQNQITGEITTTGSIASTPGVPSFSPPRPGSAVGNYGLLNVTVSTATEFDWVYTFETITISSQLALSSEYTDAAVYHDTVNLLKDYLTTPAIAFNPIPLDTHQLLSYDGSGNIVTTPANPPVVGPINPCAIPAILEFPITATFGSALLGTDASGHWIWTIQWTRFYPAGSLILNPAACILTRSIQQNGAPLPIADTCAEIGANNPGNLDEVGPYLDVGPVNITDLPDFETGDTGYYSIDLEIMYPFNASPAPIAELGLTPWGCTCQQLP